MLALLVHFTLVLSFDLSLIPPTGSPPVAMLSSSAIHDPLTNTLYSLGGDQSQNNKIIATVNSFDLTKKQWQQVRIESNYIPNALANHASYLRSDRKILNFGYWTEIVEFNLDTRGWSFSQLSGDQIGGLGTFAFTSFSFNQSEFVAIFGGMRADGYSGDLFIIDVNSLVSKKLPNNGNAPLGRIGSSIEYYNSSLYVFGYSYGVFYGLENGNELYRYDLNEEYWEVVNATGNLPLMRIGHYSAIYNDSMYIIFGYITESFTQFKDIYQFNFQSLTWTYIRELDQSCIILAAKVQVSNKVYLLYGRNIEEMLNSIVEIDLENVLELDMPAVNLQSENKLTPSERVYHCSFVANEKMYVFGGSNGVIHAASNEVEEIYNDLWAFDFNSLEWNAINAGGDIPSARRQFACSKMSGDVFAVFGGYGKSGYLDDLYYFHIPSLIWYKVLSGNDSPSSRSLACMAYMDNILYIAGGKNDIKGFDEIWTYDFFANEYSLLTEVGYSLNEESITDFNDCKCWTEKKENSLNLFIIGGSDYNAYPNSQMFQFTILDNKTLKRSIKPLGTLSSLTVIGSETSVIVTNSSIIRLGGSLYNLIMIPQILIYDIETQSTSSLPIFFMSWGHSSVHYKDTIYIFGGGGITHTYKSSRKIYNNLYSLKLSPEYYVGCSSGTFGDDCTPCPAGTYYQDGQCMGCLKGTYSELLACDSVEQCKPCEFGGFNNKVEASFCLQCPAGYFCPIGSSYPRSSLLLPANYSLQPEEYQSKSGFVDEISLLMWYAFGALVAVVCLFGVLVKRVWDRIKKVDLFVDYHENELNLPVVYKKTSCGGLFSIVFILMCFISITISILVYKFDNISEIRALIPIVALKKQIVSESVQIQTSFYIYGGSCIEYNKCSPQISYLDEGLSYDYRSTNCKLENEICQVNSDYTNLKLTSKKAKISIILKEKQSYSSAISVNITSSSSIPNQFSNIFTSIQPESAQKLFRGSTPSEFYYKFIPSTFKSNSGKWPASLTGFHVSVQQDPVAGSLATKETLNLFVHLVVNLFIVESDTAMQTQRNVNQSFFLFAATMLGSVFGLMGTFGSFMAFTENFSNKIEKRRRAKINLRSMANVVGKLNCEFGVMNVVNKSSRVVPIGDNSVEITNM